MRYLGEPHHDGSALYVTCADGLSVLETGSGRERLRDLSLPRAGGVAVHPDGARVHVVDTLRDSLVTVLAVVLTARPRLTSVRPATRVAPVPSTPCGVRLLASWE